MVDLPGEDTVKDVLKETQRQGGPIAVLAVMLTAFMLVGIGALGYVLVPAMSDYVKASSKTLQSNAESFTELSESMMLVHQAHVSLMNATEGVQDAVLSNGKKIAEMEQIVVQMSEIVQEARDMMKGVPAQRMEQHEDQMKKLQSIDDSLQQLLLEVKAGNL